MRLSQKDELDESVWTPRTISWLIVILLFATLLCWSMYKLRSANSGEFRNEYEGQIIDKWADYTHTQQGSRPYFRLVIKGNNNQQFSVSVSSEIYDRAKVGMFVRKTDAGIELSESNLKTQSGIPTQH